MIAKNLAQGLVHKMGDGMVARSLGASTDVHTSIKPCALAKASANHLPRMAEDIGRYFLGVINTH